MDAAERDDAGNAAAGPDDHLAADLLAQDPVRRADVAALLGRDGRRLQAEAVLADRRARPRGRPCSRSRAGARARGRSAGTRARSRSRRARARAAPPRAAPDRSRLRRARRSCGRSSAADSTGAFRDRSAPWRARGAGAARGRRDASAISTRAASGSTDEEKLARIESIVIPPAWRDVWISPNARAKLQATGVEAPGAGSTSTTRTFVPDRSRRSSTSSSASPRSCPICVSAMGEHMTLDPYERERVCAIAVRLINLAWFRVGTDRYAKSSRTYGVTTLTKTHVSVRGEQDRVPLSGQAQAAGADDARRHRARVRAQGPARASRAARRLFRYGRDGETSTLTGAVLNEYIQEYLGEEFTRERLPYLGRHADGRDCVRRARAAESPAEAKRAVAAVMRTVGERLGNTPAVARSSYVSPAVVEQYLDGRTIERLSAASVADRRRARYRSRSGGAGARQPAALVANPPRARGGVNFGRRSLYRCARSITPQRRSQWPARQCWYPTSPARKSRKERARPCASPFTTHARACASST